MPVNEQAGVDDALQSMNFLRGRMAHSYSFCLSREGSVPWLAKVPCWAHQGAQQPRASSACHKLPQDAHAGCWLPAMRQ